MHKKYLRLMSYLSIFVFVAFTLGVISKKQLPSPVSWSFPPVIFLESYGFHIWVFNSFLVNFWMWCTSQGFNFFFFWHVNMQFSHHCWRDCPSLLTGLGIVVKYHLTIYVTVCSWALRFIPLVYCLYAIITLFDYYGFVVCFLKSESLSRPTLYFSKLFFCFGFLVIP